MSDTGRGKSNEDILTGSTRRRSRQKADRPTPSSAANNQPGRSRRRFTVDALFSDTRPQAVGVEDLADAKEIRLDRIIPDPEQPRRTFDEARLVELVASITTEGVLQPIVVRYRADSDRYIIVHGERRFRASQRAGRETIPALVRDVPEDRRLIQQLMENIVRDDLNAVDRARALRTLKSQMDDAPWEDVAAVVGIRRSRLFQLLDTDKLPDATQGRIRAGELSEKQSRALQGLSQLYQEALGRAIMERSVPGATAQRISRAIRGSSRQAEDSAAATAHVSELLDFAIAADNEGRQAQIDRLLAGLNDATTSPQDDHKTLEEIAAALGAPKFTPERVTKSIGELAQSLARANSGAVGDDHALVQRLTVLRDVIDRLIAK